MATSTLNPNAPLFVPLAYRSVEDFSDQWWDLVRSSPSFRDYWLRECFSDPQNDLPFFGFSDYALPDFDFVTGEDTISNVSDKEKEKKSNKDLVSVEVLKWQKSRVGAELPRYAEKAPKFVRVKAAPKLIQQPR